MTIQAFAISTEAAVIDRNPPPKRRSSRMALRTAIGLSAQDCRKCSFTMQARATNLNRYGAAIQLDRELLVGSTVVVRNTRGAEVSARIVVQVNMVGVIRTYGIEFLDQDGRTKDFWGITFPID